MTSFYVIAVTWQVIKEKEGDRMTVKFKQSTQQLVNILDHKATHTCYCQGRFYFSFQMSKCTPAVSDRCAFDDQE